MRAIEIKTVSPDDSDLHALIERLDRELLALYPPEGIFGVDFTSAAINGMTFCVAYVGGTPAGCGALKPLDRGIAELKRFFVDRPFRGRGIASAILYEIEGRAREAGISLILLETGPGQPEAIGLFRKRGYREIEPYGEYAGCPYSYCMEKRLA